MKIEEFDISEECRDELRSAGIESVDDIVEFFQEVVGNATVVISWAECVDEVVDRLKLMGLLPEDF